MRSALINEGAIVKTMEGEYGLVLEARTGAVQLKIVNRGHIKTIHPREVVMRWNASRAKV